jgi:hypothetical protein
LPVKKRHGQHHRRDTDENVGKGVQAVVGDMSADTMPVMVEEAIEPM